jgi:sugar phosphate isomerase/epimerase
VGGPLSETCYAMDTSFYTGFGSYGWDARCEMLAEIGYDSTYLTLWNEDAWTVDLGRLTETRSRYGLDVQAVYVVHDLASETSADRIVRLVESLEGTSTLELAIQDSRERSPEITPERLATVAAFLERVLAAGEANGITVLLYPHRFFFVERIEQAVRLCRELDHPRLGTIFTGFHWYAVDGESLDARLAEAAPYLRSANISGSRRMPAVDGQPAVVTIEPLDSGELDNFGVLASLARVGFAGPVGIQGYAVAGDVYENLSRSLRAYRGMKERLDRHPEWGVFRPPAERK